MSPFASPLLLILFIVIHLVCFVQSRALDSYELLIGDWTVTLSASRRVIETKIFPPSVPSKLDSKIDIRIQCQCHLAIGSDGIFCLSRTDDAGSLPMTGRWQVKTNPYCATDRFYDEITLESYPRALKDGKGKIINRGLVTIRGQLRGHFTAARSKNSKRSTASIKRGLLVWKGYKNEVGKMEFVKATFVASRSIRPGVEEDLVDADHMQEIQYRRD